MNLERDSGQDPASRDREMEGLRSLPPVRLEGLGNRDLLDYFVNTWELYELLFDAIESDDSLYLHPDPLRHPLIFYLGHTAVFYLNKLKLAGVLKTGFNDEFEDLFERGIDPSSPEQIPSFDWPPIAAVKDYRRQAYEYLVDKLTTLQIPALVTAKNDEMWALLMGLEHDRIHFETSSMLIRQVPVDALKRPEGWRYSPTAPIEGSEAGNGRVIDVESGKARMGKPAEFPTFGWDNEYGERVEDVAAFAAEADLVTNRRFLEFVEDGGYRESRLWSDEGWRWKRRAGARHPKFWIPTDDTFRYRAMFDELDLPPTWPVEVNAHEAWAFCRWRGPQWRLPTEAEFRRIAQNAPLVGSDTVFSDAYNLDLAYGSPTPVGHCRRGTTPCGFHDVYGNVWQWLSDDFSPLPGFERHHLYPDFSEPYFDDRHSMMLGGSWASTGTSASRFYRLWFRREFYQHAGFRLARDLGS